MANKKFSEFVLKTSTSDVSHIVGYNGAENVQITPANFVTGGGTGVFLPLAGGLMVGNTIHNDNVKSIYGTSGDGLEIYHDSTHSYIEDTGTGDLRIKSNGATIALLAPSNEDMLLAVPNGAVNLYYNNAKKFETTSTGISVTGNGDFSGNVTIGDGTSAEIPLTFNSSATDFALGANGSNFMIGTSSDLDSGNLITLSSSGNLGIGTSSPTVKLEVSENALGDKLLLAGDDATGLRGLLFNCSTTTNVGDTWDIQARSATGIIKFSINDSEKMRLDSSGNLGLGTSSPAYKLHLLNSSGDTEMYINGQNGESSLRMGLDNRNWEIKTAAAPYLWSLSYVGTDFQTSNILTSTALGNVGIGTASPETKMNIEGTTDTELRIRGIANTTNQGASVGLFEGAAGINGGRIRYDGGTNTLNLLGVDGSATERLGIAIARDTGYVGVGNSSPSQPFVVKDGIAVTGASSEAASTSGNYILSVGKNTGDKSLHTQGDILCDGGIFLGGTAGANKLDDYEEGDWTPALGGTWTTDPTSLQGRYVKVGSTVTIYLRFTDGDKANTTAGYFTGLPFGTSYQGTGTVSDSGVNNRGICLFANTDRVWLSGTSFSSTTYVVGTYITND